VIVCSCNVLSDTQVRDSIAVETGPRTTIEVYRCLGCSPQCGRCARTIRAIMDEALGKPCDACAVDCPLPALAKAE
jgi:bacterioferritin-associated ferredoxin